MRDQLKNVQQIQATSHGAFAAILGDGSVVTWGAGAELVTLVVTAVASARSAEECASRFKQPCGPLLRSLLMAPS